jgi:hypothetical protein
LHQPGKVNRLRPKFLSSCEGEKPLRQGSSALGALHGIVQKAV